MPSIVPFASVPSDAWLLKVEALSGLLVRLTFKDPITANVGNPLGGVVFRGPGGPNPADLTIINKGPDWIEVNTLGRQFDRVQMLGPVTNLAGPSGEVATGYGMAITRPGIVNVTSVQLSLAPDELRFTFDDTLGTVCVPYFFQARAPSSPWSGTYVKSGSGPNWQEWLWSGGVLLPIDWQIVNYPSNIYFDNGYLEIPQSGPVLPTAGGLVNRVEKVGANNNDWWWANGDNQAVTTPPPELQLYAPIAGWVSPNSLPIWFPYLTRVGYPLAGEVATFWRLNAQPTGHNFVSGPLSLPQNGTPVI